MRIVKFKSQYAEKINKIIVDCFKKMELGPYSKTFIKSQIDGNSANNLIKTSETTKYYVAIKNYEIIGIGGYDKEKVRTMFVKISCQKKKVGEIILKKILKGAKRDGIKRLSVFSTISAEKFYRKYGFIKTKAIKSKKNELLFIEMRKTL